MIVIEFSANAVPMSEHGALVITQGVDNLRKEGRVDPFHYFARHVHGDWGDICDADRQANEEALISGYRLMSVYKIDADLKLWIITEADRSVTTVLLPEEY